MQKQVTTVCVCFFLLSYFTLAQQKVCTKPLKLRRMTNNTKDHKILKELDCQLQYEKNPRVDRGFVSFCKVFLQCKYNDPRINAVLCDKKCNLPKKFQKCYRKKFPKTKFKIKPFFYGIGMKKRDNSTVNVRLPVTCHCYSTK